MSTSKEYLEKQLINPNIQAALKTISHCEGTDNPEGYNFLFGSRIKNDIRFEGYDTHPNDHQVHNGINSTAAGRFQILYKTWVGLCKTYGFTDFAPHTQDLMAVAIFDMIGVLNDVAKGFILRDVVMTKLSKQWASLPFNPYSDQPEKTMEQVRNFYLSSGGTIGN